MVGRADELVLIGAFLERAATNGEALVVFGEPGIGKTRLLDAAAKKAVATGAHVVQAAGVEFEAEATCSSVRRTRRYERSRFRRRPRLAFRGAGHMRLR
jgi:chromosomal replication initiation ATPase DnaA